MRPCAGPIGQNKPDLMWIDSAKLSGPFLALLMVLVGCGGGLDDRFESGTRAMDFTLEVYQGEDELGGSKVQFEDIISKDMPPQENGTIIDCLHSNPTTLTGRICNFFIGSKSFSTICRHTITYI